MRLPALLAASVLLLVPGAALLGLAAPLPDPPARMPHAPILIEGDLGFNAANGVLAGAGTAEDPYIIAGWDILALPGALDGITLRGTTAHVVLRDNAVHEGDPGHPVSYCRYQLAIMCGPLPVPPPTRGVVLDGARNVVLEGNTITRTYIGVHLLDDSEATLRDNAIAGKVALLGEGCADPLEGFPFPPPPFPRQFTLHTAPAAGVVADGSTLRVEGGSFACAAVGIYGGASTVRVEGVMLRDLVDGVALWAGSQLDVVGADADVAGFAYTFADGTTGTLLDSTARRAQRGAWICGAGTEVLVQGNTFADGPGPDGESTAIDVGPTPGCPGDPHADLVGNAIGAGYAGIHWTDATGSIVDNTLDAGHWWGIYTQFVSPLIQGNVVRGYDQGIIARCHGGVITGNTLEGNERGLIVYHSGVQGCGPLLKPDTQANAFLGNTVYDVMNTEDMLYTAEPTPGEVALDVRGSWWGSPAGPDPAKVRGAVLADPWATTA